MPNLWGASPISRDDGGPSYAARTGSKGESRIGDVDGVWRDGDDSLADRCGEREQVAHGPKGR